MPEVRCDGARHLTLDDGLVGGAYPQCRVDRGFVLPRPVFRQEAVRREAGGAQRRDIRLAENPLTAVRVERVGRAGAVFDPGIDKFLLEPGEYGQPTGAARLAQRANGTAQEAARAA